MATDSPSLTVGEQIELRIDVYRPFIISHVKCAHLLAYLPFLRGKAPEIHKLDRDGKHVECAELLLNALRECEERGRYAAFRDALDKTGYEHVSKILLGEEIRENHEEHRKLIDIFSKPLTEHLDPIEMIRKFKSDGLLSEQDESEIRNLNQTDAMMVLLDCVPRRKANWYDCFMNVLLEMSPDLAGLVDPYFKEKKENQRKFECAEADGDSMATESYSDGEEDISRDDISSEVSGPVDVTPGAKVGVLNSQVTHNYYQKCESSDALKERVTTLETKMVELERQISKLNSHFK